MIRRRPRGETSLSKATYDYRPPRTAPNPEREKAQRELDEINEKEGRATRQKIKEAGGIGPLLGHGPKAKPTIRRR
jgi:hypothetical protein